MKILEIVMDDRNEARQKVGCNQTTKSDQLVLINVIPRRMTDAQEDGLWMVSRYWYEKGEQLLT